MSKTTRDLHHDAQSEANVTMNAATKNAVAADADDSGSDGMSEHLPLQATAKFSADGRFVQRADEVTAPYGATPITAGGYAAPPKDTTRVPRDIGMRSSAARMPIASDKAVYVELRRLAREHRKAFGTVIGLHACGAAAALTPARILGRLVEGLKDGITGTRIDHLALWVMAAVICQTVFVRLTRMRSAVLGESILASLRENFIRRSVVLPPGVVEQAGTGELLSRITKDVDKVAWAVRDAVPELAIGFVTFAMVMVALITTSPLLALVWCIGLPIIAVSSRWYFKRAPQAYRAESSSYAAVNQVLAESVDAGRTIEALRLGDARVARTDATIARWMQWESYTMRLRTRWFPSLEAGYVLPLAAVLLSGGWFYINGWVSLAQVTAGALYAQMLVQPLDVMLMWYDELQAGQASLARILGVNEIPDEDVDASEVPDGFDISADDVRFGYREGKDVLRGLNLDVKPGTRLAVVGPSGAGKSTLGRLLAGIHAARAGKLTLGGADIGAMPTEAIRKHVAIVTQEHHVFVGSLRDNLLLAQRGASDEQIWEALEVVDAGPWARDLADGLDTVVGSGGVRVGPAQSQQIALARLVLADPHTLVLDEATSLLDPRAARHLERSLAAVLDGRTVVAIAHRLQTAHDADVIAVVEDGVVSELGPHDELVAANGAYAALWASWRDEK